MPSEMMILLAILIGKDNGKQLLERPMDVTSEYMGYMYDSLVTRELLRHHRGSYQLTKPGKAAIAEFLAKHRLQAAETAEKLRQIGIEVTAEHQDKIARLLRETAGTG